MRHQLHMRGYRPHASSSGTQAVQLYVSESQAVQGISIATRAVYQLGWRQWPAAYSRTYISHKVHVCFAHALPISTQSVGS